MPQLAALHPILFFSRFLFDRRQMIAGCIVVVFALDVWQAACKYRRLAALVMEGQQ